jgi:hypothetical protein
VCFLTMSALKYVLKMVKYVLYRVKSAGFFLKNAKCYNVAILLIVFRRDLCKTP